MTLFDSNATLPIAHRGASAYAPENTLSAIRKAIELKVKHIEIDVHMTKDGEVVAIHDSSIDRTSNGEGEVKNHTLADLKKLDFGSWFSSKFAGEKIPTLKEILELTGNDSIVIIELKEGNTKYPGIEEKIVALVSELGLSKNVILKSFDYKLLNNFEKLAPEIERLYCTFGGTSWITLDNWLRFKDIFEGANFQYLQVHRFFITKGLVQRAHSKGIKLVVWDVHDKASMEAYKNIGFDFIESNNPDFVLELSKK
mgnify:CR=1 FL=1